MIGVAPFVSNDALLGEPRGQLLNGVHARIQAQTSTKSCHKRTEWRRRRKHHHRGFCWGDMLPDEMPPRGGFIPPDNLVLADLRFRRRCHYRRGGDTVY